MTNKITVAALLATAAALMPAAAAAQRLSPAVVAVVDTSRIARECNACRTAQTTLQQQVASVQQRQQQLQAPLQTEATAIQTAVQALNNRAPDAALQQRIQALQLQERTANQELQGRTDTLRSTQAHVLQQINRALGPIMNQVLQNRGATIIVDRSNVLATSPTVDVTNEVLASLNTALTTISVTPLPQQPGQQPAAQTQQQPQGR